MSIVKGDFESGSDTDDSDTSSFLPSPAVTTLGKHLMSSQTSSVPSQCSQTSSCLPSPMVTTLGNLKESFDRAHNIDSLCTKLDKLDTDGRSKALVCLLKNCDKEDLKRMDEQTINHLSKIFGEHCRDKIKAEADAFRFKRSREDGDLSSTEILSKKLCIEELHVFYESATGKSGRRKDKNQEKVAEYQNQEPRDWSSHT